MLGSCQKKEEHREGGAMPAGRIVTHDCWPLLGLRLPIKSRTLDLGAQTYEPAGGMRERSRGGGVDARCCAATVNTLRTWAVNKPSRELAYLYILYIYARRMIRRVTIDFGIWREIEDGTRSFRTMEIYTLNKIDSCARFYDIKIYIILYPRSQGNNIMGWYYISFIEK